MERAGMGLVAGIALAVVALLAGRLPGQELWILFGALAGLVVSACRCGCKSDGGCAS